MSENVHFSKMPNIAIPRSRLKLEQVVKTTFNFGELVPIDALPVMPGSDLPVINVRGVIRMSQPIVPIMDDIEANLYVFYCPTRILFGNYENWFTTGDTTSLNGGPVNLNVSAANSKLPNWSICGNGVPVGSIADHFGKPVFTADASKSAYGIVNVMKEKAYYRIWSDWFIPRQIVSSSPNNSSSATLGTYTINGTTTTVSPNSSLLPVCKNFDYFTACTLSPLYATGNVMVPLGTSAPIIGASSNHSVGSNGLKFDNGYHSFGSLATDSTYKLYVSGSAASGGSSSVIATTNMVADLSQAAGATINQLREAFAVQKYCERSNYGNRFFEAIQAHFATTSPDARLQRAEYIGHAKFLINVDQVVSTAGYNVGVSQEVGAPGAISITGFKFNLGSKGFVEPGYVVILLSTRQKCHTYSQGVLREDSKLTKFEFYSPEFANLGDQATLNKEIYLQGGSSDDLTFGYQEHWAEERYRKARVSGLMNPNVSGGLDYWTMADKYSGLPNLSASFLFENRDNIQRCLATGATGPDFIADICVDYVEDAPIPVYSIPGLIDHFGTH